MKILTECKLIENKKHLSVINKIFGNKTHQKSSFKSAEKIKNFYVTF